ncbi:MAG TPA: hypothetical protein VFO49_15810 [Nocardioides sp.]|nr:hypothetical protein [Nocardioides sp.]
MRALRTAGPAFVGLVMAAVLVATTAPSSSVTPAADEPGAGQRTAPRPMLEWSGYRIADTGKAAGGWIGARRWGRNGPVLYRVDPAASDRATSYKPGRFVERLLGKAPRSSADRRTTARAAWILSKYGRLRLPAQSAAVDAALLHLLAGGRWSLSGDAGKRRIRQSEESAVVGSLARTMLDDSRRRSGPYKIQVRQKGVAVIGDSVRLGIRVVVARNGRPLPFVPVRIQTPHGVLKGDLTRADGRINLTYPLPDAGVTPIRVRVANVPETRLRLLSPRRPSASRAAIAGKKRLLGAQDVIYVKARPRVVVTTGDKRIVAGSKSKGRFRLADAAEAWPRTATVTLHGPFAHPDNAGCGSRTARTGQTRVTGAGNYAVPRFTLRREGYYVLRVRVPGNRVNLPASDCGGRFMVVKD